MANKIKVKAKLSGDVADIQSLMLHPMETGTRKDPDTNQVVPAHHIAQLTFSLNGEISMVANLSTAVSENPYQPVHAAAGDDRSRRGDLPDAEPRLARLYRRRISIRRWHDAGVGMRPANAGQGWRRQSQVAGRAAVARPDRLHDHARAAGTVPGRSRRGDQLQPSAAVSTTSWPAWRSGSSFPLAGT